MTQRTLVMVIVAMSFATSVYAEEPFGFVLDKHPQEYGYCTQTEWDGTFYQCSSAPLPHRAFESYLLQYVEGVGVCEIKGAGTTINHDSYGVHIRSAVDDLYHQVAKRYGPTEKNDLVYPDSLWAEPRDWTMGLLKGERFYSYLWTPKRGFAGVDQVSQIGIIPQALSSDSGRVVLTYDLTTMPACEAKIQQAESAVF